MNLKLTAALSAECTANLSTKLSPSFQSAAKSKYREFFAKVSIFTELLLSRFVECASDSLFAALSKSNGELSAFTKVVNTRHISKFVVYSSVSVCGQSAVHFTNSYRSSVARALPPTWWRLCEGGGLTKVRAGDKLPNPHKTVCGHTPPLA